MNKIRVLITDDQKLLAEGIKSVIESDESIEVVDIACDGIRALELFKQTKIDVVLMDIRMPNMNGVIATKQIKEIDPSVKVLILTTFDDSDYILDAINNGASGYLLKDIGGEALIEAIKNAYAGDTILPSKIARKIVSAAKMVTNDKQIKLKKAFALSDREVEIALMIYDGFTNRQIASALKLTDGTARNYISAIYMKLGCDSRLSAVEQMKKIF
ncbi:MAG: response regulator transcription factor [Clostridia bacterium]|nr:response regulator transcription factor [Clostridia bacterium]